MGLISHFIFVDEDLHSSSSKMGDQAKPLGQQDGHGAVQRRDLGLVGDPVGKPVLDCRWIANAPANDNF